MNELNTIKSSASGLTNTAFAPLNVNVVLARLAKLAEAVVDLTEEVIKLKAELDVLRNSQS